MPDVTFLSRLQFAFTISFHILYPAFSIGTVIFLVIMEGFWLKTRRYVYFSICHFWTKIFALTFGMGVVSGIVMEFQFGTNWSGFTQEVGGVLGGLFTYEVMTAFFIEAGFLGVMLFGWNKVSPKLHYFATWLVLIGTTLSAYWILCANTWMQHPIGYTTKNSAFVPKSWLSIIFNQFLVDRYFHMLLAAYIATTFVIVSISGLYLLKKKHPSFSKTCFSFAWGVLIILTPLQIFMGDQTGTDIHQYQPIKTAAMEGVWNTQRGAPFLIFAFPDQQLEKNKWVFSIPKAAAFINTHHWDGKLIGLKSVSASDRPNVAVVFYTFRVMVYLAFFMFFLALIALYLRLKGRLLNTTWFQRVSVLCAPLGFIALWCGWVTAEEGRQPWVVYHMLRTEQAASLIPFNHVLGLFVLIILVYGVIFGGFYFYFLNKIIKHGPKEKTTQKQPFSYMPFPGLEDDVP